MGALLVLALLGLAAWLVWLALQRTEVSRGSTSVVAPVAAASGSHDVVVPALKGEGVPLRLESSDAQLTEATPPTPSAESTAVAERAREVVVRVVDAAGHAVQGAHVEVFRDAPDDSQDRLERIYRHEISIEEAHAERQIKEENEPAWSAPLDVATTDARGTATFALPAVQLLFRATRDPHDASLIAVLAAPTSADEPTSRVRLQLAPMAVLRGQVFDAAGAPASGARVVFSNGSSPEKPRPLLPRPLETDAEGRFSVLIDADFYAAVHAELGDRKSLKTTASAYHGKANDVVIRFAGAYAVTGVVLGPGDGPMSDVKVDVAGSRIRAEAAMSDARGRFRIDLAEPCRVALSADVHGFLPAEEIVAETSEDARIAAVTLHMIPCVTIAGRLQWSDGKPIASQFVDAAPSSPGSGDGDQHSFTRVAERDELEHDFTSALDDGAFTDADGRFRFDGIHPSFPYDITCYGGDGLPGRVTVRNVAPGRDDVLVTFERAAIGDNVLRGCVLDAETRAPLADCEVWCADWFSGSPSESQGVHQVIDDPRGAFEFADLDLGMTYGLIVKSPDYPRKTFGPFAPSAEGKIELLLGRHASLGLVVTDETGAPQPSAVIQLMQDAPRGWEAAQTAVERRAAGADGTLVWADIVPGEYTLEAVAGARRSPRQRIAPGAGDRLKVQLVVTARAETGALDVLVRRKDGSPWSGAEVQLVRSIAGEDATAGLEPVYVLASDAAGLASFGGLAPGAYLIEVRGDAASLPLERADVTAGAAVQITVTADA